MGHILSLHQADDTWRSIRRKNNKRPHGHANATHHPTIHQAVTRGSRTLTGFERIFYNDFQSRSVLYGTYRSSLKILDRDLRELEQHFHIQHSAFLYALDHEHRRTPAAAHRHPERSYKTTHATQIPAWFRTSQSNIQTAIDDETDQRHWPLQNGTMTDRRSPTRWRLSTRFTRTVLSRSR